MLQYSSARPQGYGECFAKQGAAVYKPPLQQNGDLESAAP
jgi:hypothetical protein